MNLLFLPFLVLWGFPTNEQPLVGNRLATVSTAEAKAFVQQHPSWYPDVDPDSIFVPAREQLLAADKQFRPTLIAKSKDGSSHKFRKEGLLSISSIAHMYCGRFFGYSTGGQTRIACVYSLVVSLPDFEKESKINWISKEWRNDTAGSSLRFDYVLENQTTRNFEISGNSIGPFGKQRFMPLGKPSEDLQSKRKVLDQRPEFKIDPLKPFTIGIGRGGGLDGFDVISLDESGKLSIFESNSMRECSFSLSKKELVSILDSVESNQLMSLCREYHDHDILDGEQWKLAIRQGDHEKTVYFNNYFPLQIVSFCEDLDEVTGIKTRKLVWRSTNMGPDLWKLLNPVGQKNKGKALGDRPETKLTR